MVKSQFANLLAGFSLCATSSAAEASPETHTLARSDGSILTYYIARSSENPATIVFNLQGSPCRSYYGDDSLMAKALNSAIVRIEKRGFPSAESSCPRDYIEHNSVADRVSDYLAVLEDLRSTGAIWNKQSVAWIGGSEGAYVASLLASHVPETKAAVLLSMGGGMSFADERVELLRKQGSVCDVSTADELLAQFSLMLAHPISSRAWCGETNTYKWWASILPLKSADYLKQVQFPIYLAVGTIDRKIPPESADAMANEFDELGKTNLTFVKHIGLDHYFVDAHGTSHARAVYNLAIAWLQGHLSK